MESVAVSLLWSFKNPLHETRVGEIIRDEMPEAYISLSVDLLPQIREFDRTSTTVVNASIGPIEQKYTDDK